jgi:hypothetical protein
MMLMPQSGSVAGSSRQGTPARQDIDDPAQHAPSPIQGRLSDRLEQARMAALANRERTQRGPAVVRLGESAGG